MKKIKVSDRLRADISQFINFMTIQNLHGEVRIFQLALDEILPGIDYNGRILEILRLSILRRQCYEMTIQYPELTHFLVQQSKCSALKAS